MRKDLGIMEGRSAREILESFDYKSKFIYQGGMEVTVPDSDRRGSMDKISFCFRNEEVVLSDLHIAYVVSLFQFTIPPVIAATIQVLGKTWSEKHIPKEATRDELLVQLIIVLQDKQDFIKVSTWIVNEFPIKWLEHIYVTSEGALKSGESLNKSMIKISKISFDETNQEFKVNAITININKIV